MSDQYREPDFEEPIPCDPTGPNCGGENHDDCPIGPEYRLLLPFDTDDPEFRRGVEVGMMWAHLSATDRRDFTIHADNVEMAIRLAESLGFQHRSEDLNDDWVVVTYD